MTYNPSDRETVVRRIALPASVVARVLGLTPRAERRLGRFHVIVEVAEWSDEACELRVRPVSRRIGRWSSRRQRRYFGLAHAAADALCQQAAMPRITRREEPTDGIHHTQRPHRRSA